MNLKKLIENQKLRIDDHKWGNREVKNWDNQEKDIHIDKFTNSAIEGKKQKVRIEIPINTDRPIRIKNAKGNEIDNIPRQLRKEIREALENRQVRDAFMKDLLNILDNFETILSDEERASAILNRLSKHFGLEWTREKIATYVNETLQLYTQVYLDDQNKLYYISAAPTHLEISSAPKGVRHKHKIKDRRKD